MIRVLIASGFIALAALGGCTASGGNAPAGVSSAEVVPYAGDWQGRLPSGKPVRLQVSPEGSVRYFYQGRIQRVGNVRFTPASLSFSVGNVGAINFSPRGAYAYTEEGVVTRTQLSRS